MLCNVILGSNKIGAEFQGFFFSCADNFVAQLMLLVEKWNIFHFQSLVTNQHLTTQEKDKTS